MPLAKKWKSVIIIDLKMITKWYMDNIAYLYLSIRRSGNSVEIFELWEKLLLSRSKLAGSGSGREILFFYRTRVRSLFTLVTHSLTDSCLVNFIDVTLACEDANSKLVDVVTVADDDLVGNNLLQIWKLRFGHKAKVFIRL